MKTKVDKEVLERICRKLQNTNLFVVPHLNKGGGLALLWKNDYNVIVMSSSDRHIDTVIDHGMNDAWHFMGFYGDPETTSWENS